MAKEQRKDCKTCVKLNDPKNFARGTNVKWQINCDDCEVTLAQPLMENENVVVLYGLLPSNYDGMSGFKTFSVTDILRLFELMNIDKKLYASYFRKINYLHKEFVEAIGKRSKNANPENITPKK